MRKIYVFCAVLFLSLILAHAAAAQMNTSLYIEEIKYRRDGTVDIEFDDNTVREVALNWTGKETVRVFDKNGREVAANIEAVGLDWLRVRTPNVVPDETYTFEIRNVSYGMRRDIVYTGFFITSPAWKIEYKEPPRFRILNTRADSTAADVFIREMEYDRGGFLEVKFAGQLGKKINLEWNGNEKVTVKDETGLTYDARIVEYERNKLEIHIYGAVENMNYLLDISNVPYNGESLSFSTRFTARDDWRYRPPRPRSK